MTETIKVQVAKIQPVVVAMSAIIMREVQYGKGNSSAEFCVAEAQNAVARKDWDACFRWIFKAIEHHEGVNSETYRKQMDIFTTP